MLNFISIFEPDHYAVPYKRGSIMVVGGGVGECIDFWQMSSKGVILKGGVDFGYKIAEKLQIKP